MLKSISGLRFVATLLLLLAPLEARAEELLVGPGETYTKIQAAIDVALNGDTVKVKDGTYAEAIDFKGKKITVFSVSGRLNATIDATGIAKSAVVAFKTAETAESILDGFTLTGGTGAPTVTNSSILVGGGIFIDKAAPTVKNCFLTKNTAAKGGGIAIQGLAGGGTFTDCGIVENQGTATSGAVGAGISINIPAGSVALEILFKDVVINKNWAKTSGTGLGGGVHIIGTNVNAKVTFVNCIVTENVVGSTNPPVAVAGDGGGMYLDTCPVVILGGEISNNFGLKGGALVLKGQGLKSAITGLPNAPVVIQGNKALDTGGGGGAIYIPDAATRLTLSYVKMAENIAGSGGGGAILFDGGSPVIDSCQFLDNSTIESGGAFRFKPTAVKATVMNSIFLRNRANTSGGAIYVSSSTAAPATFSNCVFTKNTSLSGGGAVYNKSPSNYVQKFFYCTFYANEATTGIGGIECDVSTAGLLIWNSILWDNKPADLDTSLSAKIGYSDLKAPVITKAGMLNIDPLFTAPDADPPDFHIGLTSPVLDKGNLSTDADLKAIVKDLDGKERVSGGIPDMGVYEYQQAIVIKPKFIRGLCRRPGADLTKPDLNIGDAIYLLRWLMTFYAEPGCLKGCDANDDGKPDLSDAIYILDFLFRGTLAPVAPFPDMGEDASLDQLTCQEGKFE